MEIDQGEPLIEVVRALGLAEKKGVAVAVNGSVVPRAGWQTRALAAADRVLVIQATQGG
jgi:sulfur carrier protein